MSKRYENRRNKKQNIINDKQFTISAPKLLSGVQTLIRTSETFRNLTILCAVRPFLNLHDDSLEVSGFTEIFVHTLSSSIWFSPPFRNFQNVSKKTFGVAIECPTSLIIYTTTILTFSIVNSSLFSGVLNGMSCWHNKLKSLGICDWKGIGCYVSCGNHTGQYDSLTFFILGKATQILEALS